ncbi:MAG: protein kinase [Candidatus Palauibacterales bacterium]|nr:protein kinase [Candidatus Palauibacterales bacterium]MDP2481986.1 protein kinase [Candidatus Palauibacterales bacterium]
MPDLLARLKSALAGRYSVESEIGRGGMATVLVAEDLRHKRQVAIKVLHPELAASVGPDRFQREIETVAGLTHPHILPLHDSGEADGLLYYVMPYVKGESLRQRLEREKQLPVDEAIRIAREVAGALDHAHREGIVHRDVKPANILLSDGRALLADFGVARMATTANGEKITVTGMAVGTPAYMSPEQAAGEEADERSDIYSLGCVLYELLTGEPPFSGINPRAVMVKRLTRRPTDVSTLRTSVPIGISRAVARALEKTPMDRFPTAGLFAEALETAPSESVAPPPEKSVAVLPFANMSADPENEYFCDGITEEIINALAQLSELKVAGRTSAFSFKGNNEDLRSVGEKLSVATVLEGSVRKAGDRIRITAQLIDVADGYHLWSERFDRNMGDVFAIQDEIAASIAERLQVTLAGQRAPRSVRPQTENVEAYQLYLKGRALLYQRGSAMKWSVGCFREALQLDPGYALAYAGLSDAYGILGYYGMLPPEEAWPQARVAAERAVELGPELAEAHNARALISMRDWDWDATERAFERALELNPGFIQARTWYALIYLQMVRARHDEAIRQARRAVELDPLSAYTHTMLADVLSNAGQPEEAIEEGRRGVELDTDSYWGHCALGFCYHFSSRYEEAQESYERALAVSGRHSWALGALGQLHADCGRLELARSVYTELQARSGQGYVQPMVLALVAASIGEPEEALRLAHRAADEKDPYLAFNGFCTPLGAQLRAVPGFNEILDRMGLKPA